LTEAARGRQAVVTDLMQFWLRGAVSARSGSGNNVRHMSLRHRLSLLWDRLRPNGYVPGEVPPEQIEAAKRAFMDEPVADGPGWRAYIFEDDVDAGSKSV